MSCPFPVGERVGLRRAPVGGHLSGNVPTRESVTRAVLRSSCDEGEPHACKGLNHDLDLGS